MSNRYDLARVIKELSWGELQDISGSLANMIIEAKTDKSAYQLHQPVGVALLLWSWAEAEMEEATS